MSRLASPLVEPDWSATMTAPSARRRPDQASGKTVATVAVWGPVAATAPGLNVTVAVAAGTTSRMATQSVSPVSPSKGLATKAAGLCRTISGAGLAHGVATRRTTPRCLAHVRQP